MPAMRVNREELLHQLEAVQPGLSPREIVEQSSCFVFKDKRVMAYNDEVACSHKCELDITGAVEAAKLVKILAKMPEEEVDVEAGEGELIIRGKGRKVQIRMETTILLGIDSVEKPEEWKPLHEDFCEALSIVQQCAGKDEDHFNLTCINIAKKWVEAADDFQMCRYRLKTGVTDSMLVKRDSLKSVPAFGMTEFAETPAWLHFRNPAGLTLSCRRWIDDYPDLSPFLDVTGDKIQLPKGLAKEAEIAEICTEDNEESEVMIKLSDGKLRIIGAATSGSARYVANKAANYSGPPIAFLIPPKLLGELIKHNECEVAKECLKVDGGKFIYITRLGAVDEGKE